MKETDIKPSSRKAMRYRGVECLNCGHPLDLSDRYCSYCGQINTTKRLSLKDFANEFILSVVTYDSRFRFTLKDLLFKPGTITRNYVTGKRIKYANPFRFFLSASIFYFILLGLVSLFKGTNDDVSIATDKIIVNGEEIPINTTPTDSIDINLSELKNIPAIHQEQLSIIEETVNASIKEGIAASKKAKEEEEKGFKFREEKEFENKTYLDDLIGKGFYFNKFYEETDIKNPTKALDSLKFEKTKTNLWLYSKNKDIDRVKENPLRFLSYLASKTPFFLFFFAPIFALFFWLIYSKKRANYMEHLVFIFHIFSWLFLVLIIGFIIDSMIPGSSNTITALLIIFIGPFYFYKALRNFYKQRRLITLIKFVFLNFIFIWGASFFAIFFFAVTAILF